MRFLLILAAVLLVGCDAARPPGDETKQAWYGRAVDQLAAMNREADRLFQSGKGDEAAAIIEKGQPVMKRLLNVSHPTLEATEAASDLDDLYGRMLLSNRHYGWARLLFQKNLSRWKHYQPATPETARRLKQAADAIEECDRHILQ